METILYFLKKQFKILLIIAFTTIMFVAFNEHSDFLTEQKKFERVRVAIKEKQQSIEKKLNEHQLTIDNFNLLIVAYKDTGELELYAKKKQDKVYKKIHSYEICYSSGQLGPKRSQGDYQVPEGFYHIVRFNPTSYFYLSLGLNYPNLSDRRKRKTKNLGGDIFIHGACVTVGCLPMTDDKIKEIYLFAVYAKNNGQSKIPVYVFPFRMTAQNMAVYKVKNENNKELTDFWDKLSIGYNKFTQDKVELSFSVAENGDYQY